jgi:hypothetical protein
MRQLRELDNGSEDDGHLWHPACGLGEPDHDRGGPVAEFIAVHVRALTIRLHGQAGEESWGEFRAPGRRGGGWLCREFALVLLRAYVTVRRTGRRLLARTGAESTYAIGSRVPSMAPWATSVRRRLWLRA